MPGSHDTYPKRRGLTRVPELLAAGVNVAFGHDDIMDPWYPMRSHDMLEVAHMGAHCLQMMGTRQLETVFDMVTGRGARVLGLEKYGVQVGCAANLVILQAKNSIDAIRLRPARGSMLSAAARLWRQHRLLLLRYVWARFVAKSILSYSKVSVVFSVASCVQ